MILLVFWLVLILLSPASVSGQELAMDAGTLAHSLDRLANTTRVLYVAAHPDDENTRLMAYLANQRHFTVAYLSMTRGGGGQNLIGREQEELLDVIRTEELLAARRRDGAVQRFTRMRDFGFSKSASETLAIWDHDEALSDVVWIIRSFQPDVVITRFNELPPNHGHHTASAILAREAFTAAADPTQFAQHLKQGVGVWQADRLLLNVPTWTDTPPPVDALSLDVGGYDARLGLGYAELAALSRSQHKSQGFGVAGERGPIVERFLPLAGTRPSGDIFSDLPIDWSRFGESGAAVDAALGQARAALDRDRPERALEALVAAREAMDSLPDDVRVRDARSSITEVIAACAGLFVRATAARPVGVPGSEVAIKLEIAARRPVEIAVRRVTFPGGAAVEPAISLITDQKKEISGNGRIAADAAISTPYWLAQPSLPGRQQVAAPRDVGRPRSDNALGVAVDLQVAGHSLTIETPVVHVWTDPVHGERIRSFLVVPPASVTPLRQAVMFANGKSALAAIRVRAGQDGLAGTVSLPLPSGWQSQPSSQRVELARAGDETILEFQVTPPAGASAIEAEPRFASGNRSWSYREDVVDYPHIPLQLVLRPSTLRMVPVELTLPEGLVGYVPGSGDTVAEDLSHVGAAVEGLNDDTLRSGDLNRYRAIILGVRAFNTRPVLHAALPRLMSYVENGGIVLVQYNTNNRFAPLTKPIGPFPFEVGRDRITDENAAMTPIEPVHPVLNQPNRIAEADFQGWVQERGLYYAATWDPRYQPVLRAADPGEAPLDGGVLIAQHGRGRYIYTGLAFFRQLPAGVPGAYRLFANLIASPK